MIRTYDLILQFCDVSDDTVYGLEFTNISRVAAKRYVDYYTDRYRNVKSRMRAHDSLVSN